MSRNRQVSDRQRLTERRELTPVQRQDEAYRKEQSVIRNEDREMKSECCEEAEQDEVMQIWRLGGCENCVSE